MVTLKHLFKDFKVNGNQRESQTNVEIPQEVVVVFIKGICMVIGLLVGKELGNDLTNRWDVD